MIDRKEIIDRIKKAINDNDLNSYREWAEERLVEFYILEEIIVEIGHIGSEIEMIIKKDYQKEIKNKLCAELEEIINILTKLSSAKEAFYYGYSKSILTLPFQMTQRDNDR